MERGVNEPGHQEDEHRHGDHQLSQGEGAALMGRRTGG